MQKIKVKNSVLIRFAPTGQGVPDDLTNVSALAVEVLNLNFKTPLPISFTTEGTVLVVRCGAEGQKVGKHLLTMSYEKGGRVRSFDGYAFELVENSSLSDAGAVVTCHTIELSGSTV